MPASAGYLTTACWLDRVVSLGQPTWPTVCLSVTATIAAFRRPAPDGTQYLAVHLHLTDRTGAGLLVEGTPNGSLALYDTRERLRGAHQRDDSGSGSGNGWGIASLRCRVRRVP